LGCQVCLHPTDCRMRLCEHRSPLRRTLARQAARQLLQQGLFPTTAPANPECWLRSIFANLPCGCCLSDLHRSGSPDHVRERHHSGWRLRRVRHAVHRPVGSAQAQSAAAIARPGSA
jgi:hypothetical protein